MNGGRGEARAAAPNNTCKHHAKSNALVRQRTDVLAAAGEYQSHLSRCLRQGSGKEMPVNRIIYIVGFVVIVIFVLGFLGLR